MALVPARVELAIVPYGKSIRILKNLKNASKTNMQPEINATKKYTTEITRYRVPFP